MDLSQLLSRAQSERTFAETNDLVAAAAVLHEEDVQKEAVQAIKTLLFQFEDNLKAHVRHLRSLREQEKMQVKVVKGMDRAIRYFAKSGNPLPAFKQMGQGWRGEQFCNDLSIPIPKSDDEAWEVPKDFE